jgi:hypothetical protein
MQTAQMMQRTMNRMMAKAMVPTINAIKSLTNLKENISCQFRQ